MDQQEKDIITKVIHEILMKTFDKLDYIYQKNKEIYRERHKESDVVYPLSKNPQCGLVFPAYYDDNRHVKDTRISEQELRFAFVEAFNEFCKGEDGKNWFYSVETPTKDKYSGFSTKTPKRLGPNPRSAEFDMVIYDENMNRICLIEFKANNAHDQEHKKDQWKLNNRYENNDKVPTFFVEVIKSYTDTGRKNTIDTLAQKFKLGNLTDYDYIFGNETNYYCYALEGKNSMEGEDISDIIKKRK